MAVPVAVLVEGESDRAAVLTLARTRGLDLGGRGVQVVAMGGITNIGGYVRRLGPAGRGWRLTGLYDTAEERFVRRALAPPGPDPVAVAQPPGPGDGAGDRLDLARCGFHRCRRDLEDELIRALGTDRVLEVVAAQGDLRRFRSLARQPAQRERPLAAQLHRFLGSGAGRKIRYGRVLVEALTADRVPPPLAAVVADALA